MMMVMMMIQTSGKQHEKLGDGWCDDVKGGVDVICGISLKVPT